MDEGRTALQESSLELVTAIRQVRVANPSKALMIIIYLLSSADL